MCSGLCAHEVIDKIINQDTYQKRPVLRLKQISQDALCQQILKKKNAKSSGTFFL